MLHANHQKDVQTTANGCVAERYTLRSEKNDRDIRIAVLLPSAYVAEPNRQFPVIYALPGGDAPYDTWVQMAPLQGRLITQPMIVVTFDGNPRTWYLDATVKPDSQMQTFFFDELTPHVNNTYRTNGQDAVTGFSMGGYGAMHFMLVDPSRFTAISALSGAFEHLGEGDRKPHDSLPALLGPYDENRDEYRKWQLDLRFKRAAEHQIQLPPMMIHCGTEDALLPGNRRFRDGLIELNRQEGLTIRFEYRESPGGHHWAFWRDASAALADFHWHAFMDDPRKP